jgi:A/G-specific adenine glycosylase
VRNLMTSLLTSDADIKIFRHRLLHWYGENKRDLVWRDSDNPYHVWLSEIMLQQTRVDQMGEYFERFVETFPTIESLAAAGEAEVLKVWEGLGYYARARNLHAAARQLVEEHGGRLPQTYEQLIALPGIGEYTAAAISSIAFDRDHPVLDGNVTRVLCRVLTVQEDPRKTATKSRLIAAGEKLLMPGQAGDFNQAMMELGARVCTPKRPLCGGCPLRTFCRAFIELDDPSVLPLKASRKRKPHYHVAAGVIRKGVQLLIAQRPVTGMLGGLWEFPGGKQEPEETLEECLRREVREELDIEICVGKHVISVDHAFSHFSITLHVYAATWLQGTPKPIGCSDWRWIELREIHDYAFPRADRHVIDYMMEETAQMELFDHANHDRG